MNRVLPVPKYGINDAKGAECSRIIGLVPYRFGKFFSRAVEGRASSRLITARPSDKALAPAMGEWNAFVKASTATHTGQGTFRFNGVALAQGEKEPGVNKSKHRRGVRVLRQNRVDRRVEKLRVCTLLHINQSASYPAGNVCRSDR